VCSSDLNKGQQLARVFDGSRYAGSWHWALSSSPDGIVINNKQINRVSIAGVQRRCQLVLLGEWDAWVDANA